VIVEHASRTCPTCDGRGWVVTNQSEYMPHGEQDLCPDPDCTDGRVAVRVTEDKCAECKWMKCYDSPGTCVEGVEPIRPASWAEFRVGDRVRFGDPGDAPDAPWGGTIRSLYPDDNPDEEVLIDFGDSLEWLTAANLTLDLDDESDHRKLNPAWMFPK
jgi:hypothetical protein